MPETPKPRATHGDGSEIADGLDEVEGQSINEDRFQRSGDASQQSCDDEVVIDDGWEVDPAVWRWIVRRENLLRILAVIEREGLLAHDAIRSKARVWGRPMGDALRELLDVQAIIEKVGLPGDPECRHYVLGPNGSDFRKLVECELRSR